MQDAETVLERPPRAWQEGPAAHAAVPADVNRNLYLLAYGDIYSNKGAMTPGASEETADGMSEAEDRRRSSSYAARAVPVRPGRPASTSRRRTGSATAGPAVVVGQARRRSGPPPAGGVLRAAVLRPSHGFRKGRGCHTALRRDPRDLDRDQRGLSRATSPTASGHRPRDHGQIPGGEDPRPAVAPADPPHAAEPGTWRTGSTMTRSAGSRKAGYVQLNISRLMNSAGLCAALSCWSWRGPDRRASTAHNPAGR